MTFFVKALAWLRAVPNWLWAVAGVAAATFVVYFKGQVDEREADELEDLRAQAEERERQRLAREERIASDIAEALAEQDDIDRIVEEGKARIANHATTDSEKDREVQEYLARARARMKAAE